MNMRPFIRGLQRGIKRSMRFSQPSITDILGPAIGALAVGLVAGAGLALLFAPTNGSKLREQLESKITGATKRLMSKADETMSNASSQLHRGNASTLEHRS